MRFILNKLWILQWLNLWLAWASISVLSLKPIKNWKWFRRENGLGCIEDKRLQSLVCLEGILCWIRRQCALVLMQKAIKSRRTVCVRTWYSTKLDEIKKLIKGSEVGVMLKPLPSYDLRFSPTKQRNTIKHVYSCGSYSIPPRIALTDL